MKRSITMALAVLVGFISVESAMAQELTPLQRAVKRQQLRDLEAQRQDYYRRDARAGRIESGLRVMERAGEVASVATPLRRWRATPGMTNNRWVREYAPRALGEYGAGFVRDGAVKYSARKVFDSPRVAPYNYRVWQRLGVVR